jgi:phosphoribosyl-ATP pyrophosphohydrolase/phosphoribosyl-AMP cyclohydrolase
MSTATLAWNNQGLIPAIAQDAATGAVLMMAWMNQDALERTRETGYLHFYSRSRQTLWKKGESSGHTLKVAELRVDCDGDTLLALVEPAGPACHTNNKSCFYRALGAGDEAFADGGPVGTVLERLGEVLEQRRDDGSADTSYTRRLLTGGMAKILEKIDEEHRELADELPAGPPDKIVHETADLLFHVLVGLTARGIGPVAVLRELDRRFGVSGLAEKASRTS